MKKLLLFGFVGLIGLTLTLAADDLGELARKEKAKREALQKEGKIPTVLTNEDIEKMKGPDNTGQTAGENQQTEETEGEAALTEKINETSNDISNSTNDLSPESLENMVDQQSASVDEQLKQLQQQKEEAEARVREAQEAIDQGGLLHTRTVGNQFEDSREAGSEIHEIDKKIKKLEADKAAQNPANQEVEQVREEQEQQDQKVEEAQEEAQDEDTTPPQY